MKYLQVALNVPINQTFTYSALDENTTTVNTNKTDSVQEELFKKRKVERN